MIKYADLHSEYLEQKEELDLAIQRCISNSNFILGPAVQEFEEAYSKYLGTSVVGVSSGTSAIHLALLALDIKPGDEVIVPSMTFMSTAEMVVQIGATPVFADIDSYYLLDINDVRKKVTNKTRAIIIVDLYGQGTDLIQWQEFRSQGIKLIQDAAQSSGIKYKGSNPHQYVDAQCWSFYPGKNLSAMGDAGAVSGNEEFITRVRQLSNHGRSEKYVHTHQGWNARLDAMQAAVLTVKLKKLDQAIEHKRKVAYWYEREFRNSSVQVPKVGSWGQHTWNQYVVKLPHRSRIFLALEKASVQCGIQYPQGLHRQPAFKDYYTNLPNTDILASECLSLPMHAYLSEQNVNQIARFVLWQFSDGK